MSFIVDIFCVFCLFCISQDLNDVAGHQIFGAHVEINHFQSNVRKSEESDGTPIPHFAVAFVATSVGGKNVIPFWIGAKSCPSGDSIGSVPLLQTHVRKRHAPARQYVHITSSVLFSGCVSFSQMNSRHAAEIFLCAASGACQIITVLVPQ